MADYTFERQCRTPYSEAYLIIDGERRVGHIDLHFTQNIVYGTLATENNLTEEEIMDLIEIIDEELVSSADVAREDFIITVHKGHEVGVFSDDLFEQGRNGGN